MNSTTKKNVGVELINLLDPRFNKLYGCSLDEALVALRASQLTSLPGEFALACLDEDHNAVTATRTIGVPARIACQLVSSDHMRIIIAHTIAEIRQAWTIGLPTSMGWLKPFDPTYTEMLPAFFTETISLDNLRQRTYRWFLQGPEHKRYVQSNQLPANAQQIGNEYVRLLQAVILDQIELIPANEPIGVALSGGADSMVITTVLLETLRQCGRNNPVSAVTLAINEGGSDLPQAQKVAEILGQRHPNFHLQVIRINSNDVNLAALKQESMLTLEEYHSRDVECGMAGLLLHQGLGGNNRLSLRYAFDGDGGNEIFQDYPREDQGYGIVPLEDVLADPLLFLLGYERSKLAFNPVFSSGLSRAYTRTFNPARRYGVIPFSPLVDRRLIDFGQRLPLAQFDPKHLPALRPEAVRLGVRSTFGLDLPAFPKARFQEGCAKPGLLSISLSESLKLKQLLLAQ